MISTLTNLSKKLFRSEEIAIKTLNGKVVALAIWTRAGPKVCIFDTIYPGKPYHATARIKRRRFMLENTMVPGNIHVGMNVYMALDNDGCVANALLQANINQPCIPGIHTGLPQ